MRYRKICELLLENGEKACEGDEISFNFLGEHIEGIFLCHEYWKPAEADCILIETNNKTRRFIINVIEDCKLLNRKPILTEEEINCFNSYLEDAKMDVAFGNSDWNKIYNKIVGNNISEYAREKQDYYYDFLER